MRDIADASAEIDAHVEARQACGNRCSRASRRSAGRTVQIPRIAGRSMQIILGNYTNVIG
jgi:hypothetical protein